jgi:DNA-binding NarL/FixJ family response regulator
MDPQRAPASPFPDPQTDPQTLLERGRQVRHLLSRWRLVVCTAQRSYGHLALANLFGSPPEEPEQRLLGLARRGAEARALVPEQATDVLILSQETLLDGPALPVLRQLLQRPAPPTVLLGLGTPHRVTVRAALEAGVQALISQDTLGQGILLEALTSLNRGQPFLDHRCRALVGSPGRASDELSARELEILGLVAEGCGNRLIAQRLQIAEVTARDHVQRILHKLQVPDRAAAAVAGLRRGYLH